MAKAKQLVWESLANDPLHPDKEWSPIAVLRLNNESAGYTVASGRHQDYWEATIWYGNRGFSVDDWKRHYTMHEAKQSCQRHYDSLILENSEEAA